MTRKLVTSIVSVVRKIRLHLSRNFEASTVGLHRGRFQAFANPKAPYITFPIHQNFAGLSILLSLSIHLPLPELAITAAPSFLSSSTSYSNVIMPATTAETLSLVTRNVTVAPLVLLSAADHYGRSAKGTKKRVVGVLLGQNDGKNVRVSNSFAGRSKHRRRPAHRLIGVTCSTFRGRRERPISVVS